MYCISPFDKNQVEEYTIPRMRRIRLTITLKETLVDQIDILVDGEKIRNRSHAIEYVLIQHFKPSVNKAVILAGGKEEKSSLLLIKGKPLLEYIIVNLRQADIREIIICVGDLADKIKAYFGDGAKFGVSLRYSEEKTPLGTGGALKKIRPLIDDEPFCLIHGDIVIDLNLKDLIAFHKDQDTIATVAVTSTGNPLPFGQFKLHGRTIVGFYEKTAKDKTKSHLINTGVYVLQPEIFRYFPASQEAFRLESIIPNLIKEKQMSGFVFEGQWFDAGTTDSFKNPRLQTENLFNKTDKKIRDKKQKETD